MKERRKKGNGKREIPVTGILIAAVAVLLLCLGIMVWMVSRQKAEEKRDPHGQAETVQEGLLTEDGEGPETESAAEAGRETEAEQKADPEKGADRKTQSERETERGMSRETEPETGRGMARETETEMETEHRTEPESEHMTEPEEKLVVAIDPGHQGSWVNMSDLEPNAPGSSEMKAKATTGTQGRFSNKAEYELNLEISLLLREELEKRGYEVILTREDNDTAISNAERALMAYEEGGDIYVRIHANGADDSGANGALAMVPSSSNPYVGALAADSYTLADCILSAYCEKASFSSLGIQYYDNMTGINWSRLPVMILEMGFMTNSSDDLRMSDAAVQPLMAEGIADGIDAYFIKKGLKQKEVPAEAAQRMTALLETLGEEFVYPSQDQGEDWAVSVLELGSGAKGDLNGEVQMASASVIKVFLMAAIYDRVCYPSSEERHISFEETYDGELKQLLTDMITVSDNQAANTLLTRLGGGDAAAGMAVVNQFCAENGYTKTVMGRKFLEENPSGENLTSANDCRALLESIYEGRCVGPEASAKMYEYLKHQTRTGKIPAGLAGRAVTSANKTGELAGDYNQYVENDIAVVEGEDSAYVVCILSGRLKDNGRAVQQISGMSQVICDALIG